PERDPEGPAAVLRGGRRARGGRGPVRPGRAGRTGPCRGEEGDRRTGRQPGRPGPVDGLRRHQHTGLAATRSGARPFGEHMDLRLPALGEGIESATVTQVLVKPGDAVSAGQPVLSVETDKAAMEVEADAAGTVDAVLVKPGDKLTIGAPVLRLSGDGK